MSLWDFSTFGGTPKADRPKLILSKPPPLVSRLPPIFDLLIAFLGS